MSNCHSKHAGISAAQLQRAVAAAPWGFAITDHQEKGKPVVFANQAFESASGYEAGEVLGRSWRALLGKSQGKEPTEHVAEAVRSGRRCTVVLRNRGNSSCDSYLELSVSPQRNQSGDVTHCIWLQRDVTARIEREEHLEASIMEKERRFAAYVDDAHEAIWRIDFEPPIPLDAPKLHQVRGIFDNGVFTEANDASARAYGLSKGTEVIGRMLKEFMDESDPKNVAQMLVYVENRFRMKNVVSYETGLDGIVRSIVNNITPGIDGGQVRFVWGASLDVTELFQAQEELRKSEEELIEHARLLEEKNAALKELIAQIELDKKDFKDRIVANIEQVLLPSLERINLNRGEDAHIEQHRRAIEELTSSFGRKMADRRLRLTPREIEVCNLVKNGLTSKEIASLLKIAPHTVEKHRRTARDKLGLANKGINMRTFLNSI